MKVRRLLGASLLSAALFAVVSSSAYAGLLAPVDLTPPSIAGSAQQGQAVTCSPGTWLNSPTSYTYSWQRDVTTTIGGTGNTYTLTAADVGHAITCTVVAHNSSGDSIPAVSTPILPAAVPTLAVPIESTLPTVSGSPQQGQTVTCSPGTWLNSPTAYAYSWQRDVTTAIGGTASTYTLTAADVGHAITCTVVASNGAGNSAPAVSAPIVPTAPPVAAVPLDLSPPVISGTASPGQTVTCSMGTWLNGPTAYAYSWQNDGTDVAGQTASQYFVTNSDVNHALTCMVVASNASGSSAPAISPPVIPLAPAVGLIPIATGLPSITGSAVEGKTVACSPGSWLNSPASYSYSWQRNAAPIAGQLASQYTLASSDVNQAITCTVVAHNASGDSLPAVSTPIIPALASVGGGGGGGTGGSGGASGGSTVSGGTGKGGGSGKPKLHPPTIKAFSVSPHKLIVLVKGKRRSTKGATFHVTLDQKAGVLIELLQKQIGRLKGGRCVAVTHRNAKAKHCVRWVTVKVLAIKHAKAGTTQLKYAGHVGKKLIRTGSYRAYAAALGAGGWSKLHWIALSVKAKKMPVRGRQKTNHRPPHKHG